MGQIATCEGCGSKDVWVTLSLAGRSCGHCVAAITVVKSLRLRPESIIYAAHLRIEELKAQAEWEAEQAVKSA